MLFEQLAKRVDTWRANRYACEPAPAIAEVLDFALLENGSLRYLRSAQFRALETYWYLRLVEHTITVPELYAALFPKAGERRKALGISGELFEQFEYDFDALFERIAEDNAFVREHKLESLRETLTLAYPSYILALAMGAGKTILIGAIIATEFAMAQEYPDGDFVQNALVFAPGKTILGALRELADVPYEQIIPPRLYKPFAAQLKLTFTRDGDPDIPVIAGSTFNVVVTNTEKIRIQKRTSRGPTNQLNVLHQVEDPEQELANLRLLKIASLPHLAVFSDEAHHTYGQNLLGKWTTDEDGNPILKDAGIKKVRRTVDYLAENTNLIVAVNTTGTPYFQRQPLKDVVFWYGLGEGIRDGILKEVGDNIQVLELDDDDQDALLSHIIGDFVRDYWTVRIHDGSPARMAMYFPNIETLEAARPEVETALAAAGIDPTVLLSVHSDSQKEDRDAFERVAGDPGSPHRIIMNVNVAKEGWNCPSLFACALVRKLKSSNNFVLQAATRCLRQIPDNEVPARIYLTSDNRKVLEKQLQETYGTTISVLAQTAVTSVEKTIRLRDLDMPPLVIRKTLIRYRRKEDTGKNDFSLKLPQVEWAGVAGWSRWVVQQDEAGNVQLVRTDAETLERDPETLNILAAAVELAGRCHLPTRQLRDALVKTYSDGRVPEHHLDALAAQIETQLADYEPEEYQREVALALLRPEGFTREIAEEQAVYTARLSIAKPREHLYRIAGSYTPEKLAKEKSFHYEGYNFDSAPEADYLQRVLSLVKKHPKRVEAVWFTGGITDPSQTDFYAEYEAEDGRWRRYTPDFVLRRTDGKQLIVEIKDARMKTAVLDDIRNHERGEAPQHPEGRKAVAVKRWEALNPDRLQYEVIFAETDIPANALDVTRRFIEGEWPA